MIVEDTSVLALVIFFLGFTMYTTCVIWLAFVPLYFGTANHVALRITSMSVTISLSASVTVACLFSPKVINSKIFVDCFEIHPDLLISLRSYPETWQIKIFVLTFPQLFTWWDSSNKKWIMIKTKSKEQTSESRQLFPLKTRRECFKHFCRRRFTACVLFLNFLRPHVWISLFSQDIGE